MKKNKILLFIITSLLLFSCENIKKTLGITKNSPDEFLVGKRESIKLPPDYNLLPPDSNNIKVNSKKDENLEFILNKQILEIDQTSTENKTSKSDSQNKNKSIEDQILNKIN